MNEERLHALVGKVIQDLGGAFSTPLVQIGEKLGLYEKLAEAGPVDSDTLAKLTGLAERYVREWLGAQAASGYVTYDPEVGTFEMTPEQVFLFANRDSPVYLAPAFGSAAAFLQNEPKVAEAFKTGAGVSWSDQADCLGCAVARFFRPGYQNHLVQEWLPALDGVVAKLEAGAKVADVGCGHGLSTIFMAKAFPKSEFIGIDFHEPSIEAARQHAVEHGVTNVTFDTETAKNVSGQYDLVTIFDCLHDMGDPLGAMTHIRESLKSDGTCMMVEPIAGDTVEANLNPVGRLFYCASTMVCIPTSLAQEEGAALGAQAGEARLREVVVDGAGFGTFRRATETPFNMILEARR